MAEQDNMPELEDVAMAEDGDLGDDVWGDSDDGEEVPMPPSKCLYCQQTFLQVPDLFGHCRQEHGFNIHQIHNVHRLDCFGYIKLINYVRRQKPAVERLVERSATGSSPWSDDSYMKPEIEDDPLLQFDIDDLAEMAEAANAAGGEQAMENGAGMVELTDAEHGSLLDRLQQAESRASQAEHDLQQAMTDLAKMRLAAKDLVLAAGSAPTPSHEAVQNLKDGEDNSYIDSYSHFGIHQEMLQDRIRTESYRDSMYKNKDVFKDKVVLDVGCGTGILSMFAARAGAKRVIGVDLSDVIYQAMDIVRENGLEDKITLIKGRMEDVDLPVEEVDIIVSEWMGYCLLFESMLDSVLWARERYLKPGGLVLPDHCTMTLVGLSNPDLHDRNVDYWDDVYGFKMSCMRTLVVREASVMVTDPSKLVTDECVFKELDINTCSIKDLEFTIPVRLTAESDGEMTAAVIYFDITFRLPNKVYFSTGPQHMPTHWKQTVLQLEKPLNVKKGQVLDGQFILRKNPKDPRGCKVTLSLGGVTTTYAV